MLNNRKWLFQELERWLSEGIIDKNQAEKISSLYPEKPTRSWGSLIFSIIGAVLFGLGIILLIAYNWDDLHKFAKLAIIFSSLICAHGLAWYFRRKGGAFIYLSEALYVLGTMIFGAGIWLVAQIYNIDEHYPNAFLIWGIGALALGWALPSVAQAVIASILFCFWDGFEIFDFRMDNHYAPLIILLGLFPLVWKMRSNVLLAVTVPSFILTLLFSSCRLDDHMLPSVFIFTSTSLLALSIIVRKKMIFPESSPVFKFYGNLIYWIALYSFTFPRAVNEIMQPVDFEKNMTIVYFAVLAVSSSALWYLALAPLNKIKEDLKVHFRFDHLAVPVTLFVVMLNRGWLREMEGWAGAGVFNLIFLFQSILLIYYGCTKLSSLHTAAGTLMLAFLAFARYADLFDSLLIRSLVFLCVGAGIFAVGIFYSKRKNAMREADK